MLNTVTDKVLYPPDEKRNLKAGLKSRSDRGIVAANCVTSDKMDVNEMHV